MKALSSRRRQILSNEATRKWTILKTVWLNIHSGVYENMQKEELKAVLVKRQILAQSRVSAVGTKTYEIHIKVN